MAKTEINVKRGDRANVKKTHFQSAFKYYKSSWFCSFFFNAVFLGFFFSYRLVRSVVLRFCETFINIHVFI